MQFFVTLTLDRLTSPPAALEAAMTELVEREHQEGTFVITGGLASQADSARVELTASEVISQGDTQLPIHGFAVVEAPSLDQAVEVAARVLRIHQQYVPDWTGSCEVRPIVTHCLP